MDEFELISSKCKNCGSELVYNPKQGCLTCKYCESNYFLPQKRNDAIITRQYSSDFHPNQFNRTLNAYKCNNCSNVYFMTDEGTSKKCPNCGSTSCSLVEDSGYCADGIIPFKLTKEQAAQKFCEYLDGKSSVPRSLKKLAKNQQLMGVYIPVWNFTFNISGTYSATATELQKDSQGSFYSVPKPVFGEKYKRIKSHDQSASKVENDIFLELFDENDYASLIPYSLEYTYGYRVDAIDKNIHDYYYQITRDAELDLEKEMKRNVLKKYKEVSDISVEARASDVFFNFAYVPVYVNAFEHKGKIYKTYISGTTGKVIGKSPRSIGKIFRNIAEAIAVLGIVGLLIYLFSR